MSAVMKKLNETDLLSLERYSRERAEFRARVMAHKRNRQVSVGPNTMWLFEDRLTVQYQVQEMLRTERIFEAEGIAEELDAYNPLIPDGRNWKVTLLIEFADAEVRRVQLERLRGIEDRCWVRVAGFERLYAIADEDLERENDVKTSAVHFLRFELGEPMVAALKAGGALAAGIDHPNYQHELAALPENVRGALIADLA
jgi:uncharacterized protein DUF3501